MSFDNWPTEENTSEADDDDDGDDGTQKAVQANAGGAVAVECSHQQQSPRVSASTSLAHHMSESQILQHPRAPSRATETLVFQSSSPQNLLELRKIIREELQQLNNEAGRKERAEYSVSDDSKSESRAGNDKILILPSPSANMDNNKVRGCIPLSATVTTVQKADNPRRAAAPPPVIVPFSNDGSKRTSLEPSHSSCVEAGDDDDEEEEEGEEERHTISGPQKPSLTCAPQEFTTIDKIWGILFQADGTPTKRMQGIALGVANYIVQDFLPQHSIVVTPDKMAAFYSQHSLSEPTKDDNNSSIEREQQQSQNKTRPLPFTHLFTNPKPLSKSPTTASKTFDKALAALYDDLECQYFLVPAASGSYPTVPSLTPRGFAHWLITMLQSYPNEEARRLNHVVATLPIEVTSHTSSPSSLHVDGKAERLPKQVSRYLFPEQPLRKVRRDVDDALDTFSKAVEERVGAVQPLLALAASRRGGVREPRPEEGFDSRKARRRPTPVVITARAAADHPRHRYPSESSTTTTTKEAAFQHQAASSRELGNTASCPNPKDKKTWSSLSSSVRGYHRHDSEGPGDQDRRNSAPLLPPPKPAQSTDVEQPDGRIPPRKEVSFAPIRTPSNSASGKIGTGSPQRDSARSREYKPSERDERNSAADNASIAMADAPPVIPFNASMFGDDGRRGGSGDVNIAGSGWDRSKRHSLDGYAARNQRDHRDSFSSGGSSGVNRASRRRSMMLPDPNGPTWDEYLRRVVGSGTAYDATKRDRGGHRASN